MVDPYLAAIIDYLRALASDTMGSQAIFAACSNRDRWDTVYTYNPVIVKLADGSVVKGKCQNWRDYENSDMMQVKVDGKTYLVHSTNCTLIAE